jgi:hypothetical protein
VLSLSWDGFSANVGDKTLNSVFVVSLQCVLSEKDERDAVIVDFCDAFTAFIVVKLGAFDVCRRVCSVH